jgi:Protein of unknown function (DUF1194)
MHACAHQALSILFCLLALAPAPAHGEQAKVDLELVLAADASGSVDPDEWRLQLTGIAAAFRDPAIISAIQSGANRQIAVALLVWADASRQKDTSPWYIVGDTASGEAFASAIDRFPRRVEGGTGIGSAIADAIRYLQYNDIPSSRRVVDVSGDGVETPIREDSAILLPSARSMAHAFDVTVNGLVIVNEVKTLADYYRNNVMVGSGSFVMIAEDYVDFRRAIREKLLREIAPHVAWGPSTPAAARPRLATR